MAGKRAGIREPDRAALLPRERQGGADIGSPAIAPPYGCCRPTSGNCRAGTGGVFGSPRAAAIRYDTIEIDEAGIDLYDLISGIEQNLIQKALDLAGGVRTKAARFLGLNRTTFLEKIKKWTSRAESALYPQ